MLELDSVAAYFAFAFGFGLIWYRTLGHAGGDHLRMLGFPVLGIAAGDHLLPGSMAAGPEVMGIPVVIAAVGSLIAVFLDVTLRERSFTWWSKH